MWMSRLQFFSSRKNEGLKGTDDGNSSKSNPRVVVCTHLYALSIGTVWDAMKAHLGEKLSSGTLSYKDISISDASVIQMAVSTVSNLLPLTTESFLVCRSLIGIHGSVRIMMSGQYQLFST